MSVDWNFEEMHAAFKAGEVPIRIFANSRTITDLRKRLEEEITNATPVGLDPVLPWHQSPVIVDDEVPDDIFRAEIRETKP